MKKYLFILLSCSFLLFAIGCNKNVEETKNDVEQEIEDETTEETNSEKESDAEVKEEEEANPSNDEEVSEPTGLELYKPAVGMKKMFTDGEEEILQELVIAESEEFIQFAYVIGGHAGTQVFKWTADEISLYYDEVISDYDKSVLDSFQPSNKLETIFSLDAAIKANWEVIEENAVVEVPYGKFEQVYIVQKTTDEVEGAETIYTRYYAPGYGLIKETFEVTGEYGYKGETLLSAIHE